MKSHHPVHTAVVLCCLLFTSLGIGQAPSNDNCVNAWTLYPPHIISGSTVGATTEPGTGACGNIAADVWYRFVAPFTGTAVASTCPLLGAGSASFDTVIAIRHHVQCGLTVVVGCNDDALNCALASHCSAPITIGQTYDVQLGGFFGATGNYTLSLSVYPQTPANDACASAMPIGVNSYANAETFGATTGPDPTPACGPASNDVWYSFTAPSSGLFTANTCYAPNLTANTILAVWQGACGALTQVACNDDGCGPGSGGSSATWCATAGVTYLISVGGYGGGTFSMIVNPAMNPPMGLSFFSAGAGSLGFSIANGPVGGTEFTAITLNQGAYPNAWFFGIEASLDELFGQWVTGYPFVAPLGTPCGDVVVGPFSGLPTGLTVYAVALGFAPGSPSNPTKFSNPATATIP